MRKIIGIAVLVITPLLTSVPAGAVGGPKPFIDDELPPTKSDLIIPEFDTSSRSINALSEFLGDPLELIVWPNDTRRYSLGEDQIGVYVCTWSGATGGIDRSSATAALNNEVVPFYEALSGGRYQPLFISRKTLVLDDGGAPWWTDCSEAMAAEALDHPLWDDSGVIGILDNDSNAGLATPGPYCFNCQTPSGGTIFPGNQRWAIVEGEALKSFGTYDAHITTAAHEIGHTLSFPHSYSGEVSYDAFGQPYLDEYDNPIDYMSGNMPGGLMGRRIEYPYATLAFNRYRAGWLDPSDVVFFAGGIAELTLAPVGVDGVQMVVLPTDYQYSLVTLDARISSSIDPIPSNFEGVTTHYIEQWWRDPADDVVKPLGGAPSRVYTYPPSPDSLNHVTAVGGEATFNLNQGEDLIAQGTKLKVIGETADGFQVMLIGFDDTATSVFLSDIIWLAESGITKGCNDTSFCPNDYVTRGQMAAFLARALGYTDSGDGDLFTDDNGSVFETSIDRLATAGVTKGCNPPVNDNFCPNAFVTREQMAAFLVRALGLTDDGGGNNFVDDDDSIFQNQIAILAHAEITKGCNPPENTRFCPYDRVTREQMAAFLRRALG